jgi:dipeptidyl aminopeptidase/acylaminoacyl peptidase
MFKRIAITASLVMLAAALAAASASALPARNGAVVFSMVSTEPAAEGEAAVAPVEKGGLYAAKEGRLNQLTEDPGDSQPDFSRDGRTIVFSRGGDIYSVRADGSGQRTLTSGPEVDERPIFSPNGRIVVFERRGGRGAARLARSLHRAGRRRRRACADLDSGRRARSLLLAGRLHDRLRAQLRRSGRRHQ